MWSTRVFSSFYYSSIVIATCLLSADMDVLPKRNGKYVKLDRFKGSGLERWHWRNSANFFQTPREIQCLYLPCLQF